MDTRELFPTLYGNAAVKKRIYDDVQAGTLPHAFLIDGPQGSGKYTLARLIASTVNCERRSDGTASFPCCECNSCRRIREGIFSDVRVLEREGDRATIGVDSIKALRSDMFLSATESTHKFYIIRDAERLTPEAQNALLIVLEEPPKNVVIMLLASGTDRILTTIKSRTQYIAMSRFKTEEVEEYLTRTSGIDGERAHIAALGSGGVIGQALMLSTPASMAEEKERRETVDNFISAIGTKGGFADIYAATNAAPQKRQELLPFLERLMDAVRDLIAIKRDGNAPLLYFPDRETATALAETMTAARLMKLFDILLSTHDECSKNANVGAMQLGMAAKIRLIN